MGDLAERGWQVVNADVCLIGERPKIGPHRIRMRDRVAPLLGLAAVVRVGGRLLEAGAEQHRFSVTTF